MTENGRKRENVEGAKETLQYKTYKGTTIRMPTKKTKKNAYRLSEETVENQGERKAISGKIKIKKLITRSMLKKFLQFE